MQLLRSGFDSRHRHVAGKWSFEVGWWSFRSGKRIETVDVFDILVRISCIFSPVVGKFSHFRKWRMIYGQLGRNGQVVGTGLFGRIGPIVCLTLLLYTDLYKSLFSNIPIEGPSITNLSLAHI